MIHLLEHCRIAPPPDSVEDKSIPLTFFDMPWLYFPSMKVLFFYEFSHPKAYFVDTIIPRLKHSLSLTLKHFFPLSGNLIFLTDGSMPEILYKDGDSVSLTFSECISDLYFHHLSGNHQRTDNDFHPFTASTNSTPFVVPILSIRVTLFPNSAGICIGLTHHHVASDANTFLRFVRSWASINKLGGDATITENPSIVPFYDRSFVKDPIWIRSKFWSHFGEIKSEAFQPPPLRTNTVLATFILGRAEVQRLKKLVISQIPKKSHVSAFTVVCGYVWSCMVKARARNGEEIFENGSEHLVFSADCRTLLDPPIPTTYFGNCIICFIVTIESRELIQEDGFIVAAKLIGEAIQERVLKNKEGILKSAEKWVEDLKSLNRSRMVAVSGSPRFDAYDMDFGFGRPKKFEAVSPREVDSFSIFGCKDNKEDFELGLHLPKANMDAFADIFTNGIKPHSCL